VEGCVWLSSAQCAGSLPAQQRQGQRLISSMDDLEEVTGCPIGVNRVFRASSRVIGSILKALGDLELSQSGSAWWCVKKPEPLSRQSMDGTPITFCWAWHLARGKFGGRSADDRVVATKPFRCTPSELRERQESGTSPIAHFIESSTIDPATPDRTSILKSQSTPQLLVLPTLPSASLPTHDV
jgi:hypothetical protein